jgi:Tfp pilus assembly protein PilO
MSLWTRVLSEKRGLVVPIGAALVINILVAAAAVWPLMRSVDADETRATDVKVALAEAHRLAKVATDTRDRQQQANDELKKFYADVVPRSLADARDLLYLQVSQLSAETGLVAQSSAFEPLPLEDSALMKFRVDVSLTGEYAGIRRFLYLLETSERFFIVEAVKLGQSGQRQGSSGSIEVVVQMATYYGGGVVQP